MEPLIGPAGGAVPPALETTLRAALGRGRRLVAAPGRRSDPGGGRQLAGVRVHTDARADFFARLFGAAAFTVGSDIFFRRGAFDPASPAGRRLIAHELAHVAQQRAGRVAAGGRGLAVRPADDPLERETEAAAPLPAGRWRLAPARPVVRPRPGPLAVQRAAADIVAAAQVAPPVHVERRFGMTTYGPVNCHEAALGWLLEAEGFTRPWQLVHCIKFSHTCLSPRTLAHWLNAFIYQPRLRVWLPNLTAAAPVVPRPAPGDILFTLQGASAPWHSMVVVHSAVGSVRIRGFNNAGTFNYPAIAQAAPAGQYDGLDRDITDAHYWHGNGMNATFGAQGGNALYVVRYQDAANNVRNALQLHWSYSFFRTPGWQHAAGATACPASCPH